MGPRGLVPLDDVLLLSEGQCAMDGSQDAHYRYKMPVISVKVEGTTKMIRTVLPNLAQVAQAIGRPSSYLITYLGQQVSAMSQTAKIDRDGPNAKPWLSGKHEQRDLQLLVFKFIRESVLCPACNNPETTISISGKRKKRAVTLTCGACGAESQVPPTTKFAKWMAQHPPSAEEEDALTWGRVTGADTDQIDAGSGDVETDRHTAKEVVTTETQGGGADGGEVGRCGKGREPNTLEEIAEFKNKEALRLKAMRSDGTISEDRYNELKQQVKERCKLLKAALL